MTDTQTIEEALGLPEWYGAERVAYLNDASDLVLQVRQTPVTWGVAPMRVVSTKVVRGSDADKIKELQKFRRSTMTLVA